MSHQTNGNDAFSGPITIPDTLDTDYNTVTVPGALQALADRTYQVGLTIGATTDANPMDNVAEGDILSLGADFNGATPFNMPVSGRADYLRAYLMSIAAKVVGMRQRVFGAGPTPVIAAVPIAPVTNTGGFASSVSAGLVRWIQTSIVGTQTIVWPIPGLPIGGTITGFTCYLTGGLASHSGSMPASKPTIELLRAGGAAESFGASASSILVATDPSANTTAYEVSHTISSGAITETIDPIATYYLRFTGESSTNSVANAVGLFFSHINVKG